MTVDSCNKLPNPVTELPAAQCHGGLQPMVAMGHLCGSSVWAGFADGMLRAPGDGVRFPSSVFVAAGGF